MTSVARLRQEILADKRKSAILGGLAAIALVMGGRALLSGDSKPGPRRAQAAQAQRADASNGPASGRTPGAEQVDASSAADAERRLREFMAAWSGARSGPPTRDLFALDSAHFPDPSQADRRATGGAKSAGVFDDDGVDSDALRRDLARLQLKSVMSGNRTIAIFDLSALGGSASTIARVGDEVGGFRVERIGARGVTLSRDGVSHELRVTSPLDE